MGTLVAVCRVYRWTLRDASSVIVASLCRRCRPRRLWCFSASHGASQQLRGGVAEPARKADGQRSLRSLLDMGFTDTQAERVHDAASRLRGAGAGGQVVLTITVLSVLGLNPSSVLKVLQKCPELYTTREAQLHQRVSYLRKLGLGEGSLQRVVAFYPQILMVPVRTVKNVVLFLKERCLFTTQQVRDILRESPAILVENTAQLEYKFQYVYFRMGVKQEEIVKAKLFSTTLEEVRHRHCFLERRGLYQTPDKNGKTTIVNPKLDTVLHVNEETFLAHLAKASAEEYDVFKRLVARQWKDEEQQLDSTKAEGDSDDEEEEEEDVKTRSRRGYMKKTKKTQN